MKNLDFEQFNFTPTPYSQSAVKIYYRHRFSRKLTLNGRHGLLQSDIDFLRSTGNYPEDLLKSLDVRNGKPAKRSKHKIHKTFTPNNITKTIKFSIGIKLVAPVSKHDINLNPYIRKLRKAKKQRLNVRDELEELCKAAFPAFIKYAEYSIYAECLFEIKAPLKQLAYELGLLSPNGRYDRLNRLIEMMQEAGFMIAMHEFDKEQYKQKAVRLFLLPDFFYSLGHTETSLKKMVASTNLHLLKRGGKNSLVQRAKAHEERLKDLNVADMRANPKNAEKYDLLRRIKANFIDDKVFRSLTNKITKFEDSKTKEKAGNIFDSDLPDLPLTIEELSVFCVKTPTIDKTDKPTLSKRRLH